MAKKKEGYYFSTEKRMEQLKIKKAREYLNHPRKWKRYHSNVKKLAEKLKKQDAENAHLKNLNKITNWLKK